MRRNGRATRAARSTEAVERRISGTIELRDGPSGSPMLVGYGAVFNQLSDDLGGFRELIEPGAFTKTLNDGADVRALFNHDPNLVLGRARAGTLRLREDERGLAYEIDVPDTQYGRDLVTSMKRGDITQSSFAFRPLRWLWEIDEASDTRVWRQQEVALYDVSPVTYPAYPQTSSAVRSILARLKPGELPERGMFDNVYSYGPNGYRWTDPDVAFLTCLIDHYSDLLEAAAVVPGQVDRPEALALATEILASAPGIIQRCSQILEMIAAEGEDGMSDAPMAPDMAGNGSDRESTPPQAGHLLALLERELDLIA